MDNNFYNKRLKNFARSHRKDSTKMEIRLWCELLRNGQMGGYQFLRQRAIGNFIADFVCMVLKLIIEVDGISHDTKSAEEKDVWRQQELEKMGFKVMRFGDEAVKRQLPDVAESIYGWILDWEEKNKII